MMEPVTIDSTAGLENVEPRTTVMLNYLRVELKNDQWLHLSNNGKSLLKCTATHKPRILQGVKEGGVVSVIGLYRYLNSTKTDAHVELNHVIIEPYYY